MESLIGLVNRIQRACTVLGDYGGDTALPTLWEALPSVVVVGGQVCMFMIIVHVFVRSVSPLCFQLNVLCVEFGKVVGVGEHCWA